MKKYITLLIFLVNVVCFSQQKSKVRIDTRIDQIRIRLHGAYKIAGNTVYSFAIIRLNRAEYYKELRINIDEHIFIRPALGFEYNYKIGDIKPKLRLNLVGDYQKYTFRVNYGSDFETNGVSTRLEYKLTKNFWLGVQSSNELVGPRIDWNFKILGDKKFKLGTYYLTKEKYGFSLRFDIFEFFPKVEKIKDKWEESLNKKLDKIKRNKNRKS